jgi:hypothetical protein
MADISPEIKDLSREADNKPPSSAEVIQSLPLAITLWVGVHLPGLEFRPLNRLTHSQSLYRLRQQLNLLKRRYDKAFSATGRGGRQVCFMCGTNITYI